jgi:hypothetical protein
MLLKQEHTHCTHVRPPDIHDIYGDSKFDNPKQITLLFLPKKALLMKIMRAAAMTQYLRETAAEELQIDDGLWWIRDFNFLEFH